MPRKRYKPEEIVAKLRQVDVLVSQGTSMEAAKRRAAGAGLDGEGADQVIIDSAVISFSITSSARKALAELDGELAHRGVHSIDRRQRRPAFLIAR